MRIGPKVWRKIFVSTPEGSATQLYLGVDKSLAQQSLEVTTKRMSSLVAAALGSWSEYLFTMRAEGLLFFDWQPLAQIRVQEGGKGGGRTELTCGNARVGHAGAGGGKDADLRRGLRPPRAGR